MDYRRKHLKPKDKLAANILSTLHIPELAETLDFFQTLRKNGFLAQLESGTQEQGNYNLTS